MGAAHLCCSIALPTWQTTSKTMKSVIKYGLVLLSMLSGIAAAPVSPVSMEASIAKLEQQVKMRELGHRLASLENVDESDVKEQVRRP